MTPEIFEVITGFVAVAAVSFAINCLFDNTELRMRCRVLEDWLGSAEAELAQERAGRSLTRGA